MRDMLSGLERRELLWCLGRIAIVAVRWIRHLLLVGVVVVTGHWSHLILWLRLLIVVLGLPIRSMLTCLLSGSIAATNHLSWVVVGTTTWLLRARMGFLLSVKDILWLLRNGGRGMSVLFLLSLFRLIRV